MTSRLEATEFGLMLEALQFLFSDFWHWFGAFLMLTVLCGAWGKLWSNVWAALVAWSGRKAQSDYD